MTMIGVRICWGMETTFANRLVRYLPCRNMKMFTRIRPSMMAYMIAPSVVKSERPGFRPQTALLADSAAATPSTEPWPNSSGCLDIFFAVL